MQQPPNLNDNNSIPNEKLSKLQLAINMTYSGANENKWKENMCSNFVCPPYA